MTQLSLFDTKQDFGCSEVIRRGLQNSLDGSIARASDPATSHMAADEVAQSLSGYRAIFVAWLQVLGQATANEVAGGNESIRKRARECARLGLVRECGVRACMITGKQATVWEVAHGEKVQDEA